MNGPNVSPKRLAALLSKAAFSPSITSISRVFRAS
jgi:hypothetical protein